MPTAAQLAGLQFDAPADQLAVATTTSFQLLVSDGTVTVNAGTTINVTPVNDAPVASSSTITVAEESVNTPLGLAAPTDVDGNALTITVTSLPTGAWSRSPTARRSERSLTTAAQLTGLQFDAPADLAAATTALFTYSVSDGTTTVNAGTTINVTPVNVRRWLRQPASQSPEDAAIVNGAVTATDADVGATFTFALNGAAFRRPDLQRQRHHSFNPANAAYQSLSVSASKPSSRCPIP